MNENTDTKPKAEYCNCCGIEFGHGEDYAPWPSRKNLDYLSSTDEHGNKTYCCDECQQDATDYD